MSEQQQQSNFEVDGGSNEQEQVTFSEEPEPAKTSNESHGRCFSWLTGHHLGWLARIPGRWPRTVGLAFGVILPLFLLIGVSLFFGYGLAKLEAPSEIEANNEVLANRALVQTSIRFSRNVTEELPEICLGILVQQQANNNSALLNVSLEEALDAILVRVFDYNKEGPSWTDSIPDDLWEQVPGNSTRELFTFMQECGTMGLSIASRFFSLSIEQEYFSDDLTFDWIRCDGLGRNESSSLVLLQQIWGRPYTNRTRLKPDVQEADAIAAWRKDAAVLYNEKLEQLLLENTTSPINARTQAYQYAIENANGFNHCNPNSAAGAWFWFTVMTTIGYGNTAPVTKGGRAMIYTLGFFSILLFASVLGTAGTIVVAIWDDFIKRTKLHQLNIPWVACIFWGFCYYAWMLVIAVVTQNWKAARLDEAMDFSEAYWFSYISTTTVGLGDYHLEHDVILRQDLITFPVLFLSGFVLLANFFVKLSEILTSLVPHNRPTLEETLAESDVPCMPKLSTKHLNVATEHLKAMTNITHTNKSGRKTESKRSESNEDATEQAKAVQIGNADPMVGTAAHPHSEPVSIKAGDGWKGTMTGVAAPSSAEDTP